MASPTASAAAAVPGPVTFTTNSPTSVATRWPPISARGCAASISGEPITSTIEVANGTNSRGMAVRAAKSSIRAMAIAAPAAPATTMIARRLVGFRSRRARNAWRATIAGASFIGVGPKKNGRRPVEEPPPADRTDIALFQIGHRCQVSPAGHNEGGAAPTRAEATRIDRGEVTSEACGIVAGEGVAVTLVHVGVEVTEVKREYALGDRDTDVPGGVALVGNAVRERRGAALDADLGAVECVARAQEPFARIPREVQSPAFRHGRARRRQLRTAGHIGAVGARIEHGRGIEGGAADRHLIIHRVSALGIDFPKGQVLLDDVAVDREIEVLEAVRPEDWGDAAVVTGPARVPVDDATEIERERAEGRADAGVAVDLGCRAVRERDAGARHTGVELEVRAHVVARLEVCIDRRVVVRLRDAAENIVRRQASAEREIPRVRRRRRRRRR